VHVAVLDDIQRRQLRARRLPREMASPAQLAAFLLRRHHVHPDHRLVGPPGVLAALELLQGVDLPLRVWEQEVLGARVEGYEREWLDRLGLSGEVVWTTFDHAGSATPRIGAALRENLGWLRERTDPAVELDTRTKNVLLHLQLRGASFAQDLARLTGLRPEETQAALWDLFRAGLIAPDTYSAILATATPPRPAGDPVSRPRWRRGQARGPRRELPVVGRWSSLGEDEALSPEERAEARAHLLLARYGVLTRELADGEWSTLRHALLRMEYGNEVVRGYFVEGLSGEQYASESALEELAAPARRDAAHALVAVIDPANVWGPIFTLSAADGRKVPAPRGAGWLVLRHGAPVALLEGHGRELTTLAAWQPSDLEGVANVLAGVLDRPPAYRPVRRIELTTWDGKPVAETDGYSTLKTAGLA
jgi:ATP-dependent helicase Lhr and Lhr-like helicase